MASLRNITYVPTFLGRIEEHVHMMTANVSTLGLWQLSPTDRLTASRNQDPESRAAETERLFDRRSAADLAEVRDVSRAIARANPRGPTVARHALSIRACHGQSAVGRRLRVTFARQPPAVRHSAYYGSWYRAALSRTSRNHHARA